MINIKQLLMAVVVLLCSATANAHDFEVDGIYYNVTSTNTVEVTCKGSYYNDLDEYNGNVVIPSSVNYNGKNYSVTRIGEYTFRYCDSITSLSIPNSVIYIDYYAFEGCTFLKDLRIEDGETPLEFTNHLYDCSLKYCPLESLYLGRNLKYSYTSGGSGSIDTSRIPFANKQKLISVTISDSVTNIMNYAFYGCSSLTYIEIPNSVTSIRQGAFYNCSGLTSVTIGSSVTSIEQYAFAGCRNIETIITLPRIAITCNENIFSDVIYNNAILYVPEGREFAYGKTTPWSNFYIEPMKKYNVTYMLDGNEYAKYSVEIFSEIPVPETPFKEGYTFKGWDNKPLYMPKNDVTINGSFEVNTYAVTYIVDGDTVAVDSVAYGAEITPIAAPVKEGYTFSGWSEAPATMPANDIVISGSFEINTYVVTYLVDGKTFATDSIVFNGDVNVISAPEKEGYTFSGWSYAPKKMPAEDIVISGTFFVNYYTITYLVDGEEYSSESVAYGTEIKLLDAPVKDGYTFSGWSDAPMTMPAENITIIGSFVATGISYVSADARIKVNGNSITLSGANNSAITIYTANGALVEKIDCYDGKEIILGKGVYIVRVDGKAVKVKL